MPAASAVSPTPRSNSESSTSTHRWFEAQLSIARPYRVAFTQNAFAPENPTLAEAFGRDTDNAKALVVLDAAAVTPRLRKQINDWFAGHDRPNLVAQIELPGGEACKNDPTQLDRLHQAIFDHMLDRRSFVLAIGGGALLDVAGFAAATAHRGVRLIRMPSTTLAQADSGVGVKNAVNRLGIKNAVGTFAVPWAVVNDQALLETLPDDVWREGLSEVVKVALIKDPGLFAWLEKHAESLHQRDERLAHHAWQASARLHAQHIVHPPSQGGGGDPFEDTTARPLDLGHWSAHTLEEHTQADPQPISHGRAVALGLALDLTYAQNAGLVPTEVAQRVIRLLNTLGLPTHDPLLGRLDLPAGLDRFRQHLGGQLAIPLIRNVGQPITLDRLQPEPLQRAIQECSRPR